MGVLAAIVVYAAVRVVPEVLLDGGSPAAQGAYAAGLAVLLAASLGFGVWQNRRRLGGKTQAGLLRRALREGRVPQEADREAWSRELPRRLRFLRESRWLTWVSLGAFAVLAALVGVLLVAGDAEAAAVEAIAVVGVVLLGVLAATRWLRRRNERRLGVLLEHLDRSDASAGR